MEKEKIVFTAKSAPGFRWELDQKLQEQLEKISPELEITVRRLINTVCDAFVTTLASIIVLSGTTDVILPAKFARIFPEFQKNYFFFLKKRRIEDVH